MDGAFGDAQARLMSHTHDTRPGTAPQGGERQPPPRLTRSSDDKVIAGLCGGLGLHFGVDPVIFRIAFVVLASVLVNLLALAAETRSERA